MCAIDDGPFTFAELKRRVVQEGTVLILDMRDLRDMCEYGRLGPDVIADIGRRLYRKGIGHYPRKFPKVQEVPILVYSKVGLLATCMKLYPVAEAKAKVLPELLVDAGIRVLTEEQAGHRWLNLYLLSTGQVVLPPPQALGRGRL